jgi:hypothetical protein
MITGTGTAIMTTGTGITTPIRTPTTRSVRSA